MVRFLPVVFCLAVLGCPSLVAQSLDPVALVNGEPISQQEFESRFLLTIFPHKDQERFQELAKWQALYSLIGERLLRAEAMKNHVDLEPRLRASRDRAEEMFVRDKLYRDVVRAAVKVSPEEVRLRYRQMLLETEFTFLLATDRSEALNLHALLTKGMDFDTLLASRRELQEGKETTVQHNSGTIEPKLRKAMAVLEPGGISAPIETRDGWIILRRRDLGRAFASEEEYFAQARSIAETLRREKEAVATVDFVQALWKGLSANIQEHPFRIIGQALLDHLHDQARADTTKQLLVDPAVFDALRRDKGLHLHEAFAVLIATGSNGNIVDSLSVEEMLDRLQAQGVRIEARDWKSFPDRYRTLVNEILDLWLVTKEGRRRNLQMSEDVKRDLDQWMSAGLAQTILDISWEQFIASDDSLWAFYLRNHALFGPPVEVRLIEILKHDSADFVEVQSGLALGIPMEDLALRWSERDDVSDTRGFTDYFPVVERGIVGRTAFGLRIADIAGPLKIEDGWSLFQVQDKRYPADTTIRSMEQLRERILDHQAMMYHRKAHDLLVRLASQAEITINEEVVKGMNLTPMQMFTVRFLGFGGRIPAAPGIVPWFESVIEGMAKKSRIEQ